MRPLSPTGPPRRSAAFSCLFGMGDGLGLGSLRVVGGLRVVCALGLAWGIVASLPARAGIRDRALKAIEAGDVREAKKAIESLDAHIGSADHLVLPRALNLRYQTEARLHHSRDREADTLAALRQACLVHPTGKPNASILGPGPLADTFYAVCAEVQQRPEVDLASLGLPDAPVRIDGVVPGETHPVRTGRHLVQVQCADGKWTTQWSELKKAADWGEGCTDGALAPAEEAPSDDPMDSVPFFGAPTDGEATDEATPDNTAEGEATEEPEVPEPPPPAKPADE